MDVALTRVFKFNTRQCARQHPEYLLVSSLITYANTLCLWIKLFATMCWRHLESTYNQMFPRTFLEGGGRDIERNQWPGSSDIDGQDQCEHMLNLVTVIAIFWVHRETMVKASQYVVENHKNSKQWVFGYTAQVHILLENLAYGQWCLIKVSSPE